MKTLRVTFTICLTFCFALSLAHCGGDDESNEPKEFGTLVKSEKKRLTVFDIDDEKISELAAGNTDTAFDIYREIKDEDENLFLSPFSISIALAMSYAGARNNTETEMAEALNFTLPQNDLHEAFNYTDLKLNDEDETLFQLSIANAIWMQKGYDFVEEYLDTLALNYGAGIRLLDFAAEPEASRSVVNEWVEYETNEKIKNLLPQGTVSSDTKLILTNAIYFLANWKYKFEKEDTQSRPFNLIDGGEVTAPTMREWEELNYMQGEGYQAVELPYKGGEISMLILLPDEGEFSGFEENLNRELLEETIENLEEVFIEFLMPKFEYEQTIAMKDILIEMGMKDAFDNKADFSAMNPDNELYISAVHHKAFIKVDEKGTEAAAATAVVNDIKASSNEPEIILNINRPFIHIIRHRETGNILFIGRVIDPT